MVLSFNLAKSHLTTNQTIQRLGMSWDSSTPTVSLSRENQLRCRKQVFRALHSNTFTRRQ